MADAVPDTAVEDFPHTASIPVVHENLDASGSEIRLQGRKIIIKEFFKNRKVMKGDLINASLNLSYNLTGRTVGILIVYKQKCQVCMP